MVFGIMTSKTGPRMKELAALMRFVHPHCAQRINVAADLLAQVSDLVDEKIWCEKRVIAYLVNSAASRDV